MNVYTVRIRDADGGYTQHVREEGAAAWEPCEEAARIILELTKNANRRRDDERQQVRNEGQAGISETVGAGTAGDDLRRENAAGEARAKAQG